MLDEAASPASEETTPSTAVSRFNARSLLDLLETLRRIDTSESAQSSAADTARTQG
jgi:hypothetical protein